MYLTTQRPYNPVKAQKGTQHQRYRRNNPIIIFTTLSFISPTALVQKSVCMAKES